MCCIDKMADTSEKSLNYFLKNNKRKKDQLYTHTALPNFDSIPQKFAGSYTINSENYSEFLKKYYKSVFENKNVAHLTEKHLDWSPVLIDLDFRFPYNKQDRQYNESFIEQFLEIYISLATDILDVSEAEIFVLEKKFPKPNKEKNLVKDGIHIMIPDIVTYPRTQYVLRHRLINDQRTIDLFKELGSTNSIDDIVDLCVIEKNNWQMYGSMKPNNEAYLVTKIYDLDLNPIDVKKYSNFELLEKLSLRNKPKSSIVDVLEDACESVDKEYELLGTKHKNKKTRIKKPKKKRSKKLQKTLGDDKELKKIKSMVEILNPNRANSYDSWIKLGWCLHNIDYDLLDSWIKFSKNSSKFGEGICEDEWENMDNEGLGKGTLYMWAKEDNPQKFKEITKNDLRKLMYTSLSMTHHDIAKVIFEMNKDQFKYSKNKSWYQFKNHRWHEINDGIHLRKKFSSQVLNEYLSWNRELTLKAEELDDDDIQREIIINQLKKIGDLQVKLKTTSFKKTLMEECTEFFYDDMIEELLDSNLDLICFENGVYDLQNNLFRDGIPEDYISFCTNIHYEEFEGTDEYLGQINTFLQQILPNKDIREYVVTLLSSFLDGHITQEKFPIWTGTGGNGKSKLIELFTKAFGEYTKVLPIALLTQKRARSEAANPDLVDAKGRRFCYFQEPDNGERINIGLMKELTGGDKIKGRTLFKLPIEFKPQFKLALLCNDLPEMPGNDDGTWRRVRVVRFKSKFREFPDPKDPYEFKIDTSLPDKFDNWAEPFMYMLLQYYKKYKQNGLFEPPEVKMETQNYKNESDTFSLFFSECIEYKDGHEIKLQEAFNKFKTWYSQTIGSGKTPSRKEFQTNMIAKYGKGEKNGNLFKGIEWVPEQDDPNEHMAEDSDFED